MNTRRITFTVMLRMSVVAAALAGMLYAGRLESGRYRWGTGYERSVIAAVILVGTGTGTGTGTGIGLGSVIGSLFGSQLIGMINIGFILAGLGVSSGRSWSASS